MQTDRLSNLLGVIAKLPPPPVNFSLGDDLTKIRCACGKVKNVTEMQIFFTGHTHALDNVCRGCERTYKDMARIVCVPCRKIVARMPPHTDPIGFRFVAGVTYHTEGCPDCDPSVKDNRTLIVEQFLYHQERGRKM